MGLRRGHSGDWTWDDAAAARLQANATARPRGLRGPSPDELGATRSPIASREREASKRLSRKSEVSPGRITFKATVRPCSERAGS
jgi:hypothetical protein